MVVGPQAFDFADAVAKEPQVPLGADPRVEQADAAGRAHCGVLANSLSSFVGLLLVQPHQVGVGHVDFAAHFQHRRHVRCPASRERYAQHGADIVRDVVADAAVAPRDAPY